MPEYLRSRLKGGIFFFTLVTYDRRPILATDLGLKCLRHAWRETNATLPFHVEAVCVLPDHLHTVWALPEDDEDYSTRWRKLKGVFSREYRAAGARTAESNPSRLRRGEVSVWQRRFWEHRIRDGEDLRRHVEYIHYNPIKHGLVKTLGDWPHSSLHDHINRGWLDPGWGEIEPHGIADLEAGE
jgi:putative transposase